jgi:hypothetical protein
VAAQIAYNISLVYPFYPTFAADARTHLIADSTGRKGGLDLDRFPAATWSHEYSAGFDGKQCVKAGDKCTVEGTLLFSWRPSNASTPASCSLNSAIPQQFGFLLGCASGVSDSACVTPLRTAVRDERLGQFTVSGSPDFCAGSSTNFSAAWPKNFGIQQ